MGAGPVIFPDPLGGSKLFKLRSRVSCQSQVSAVSLPPVAPKIGGQAREKSCVPEFVEHQRQGIKELTFNRRWYLSSLSSNAFKGYLQPTNLYTSKH